ncbi:Chloroperoxidase [Podospora fimiseda]|uniref:Chloroperoxidase n=1 Tax=Podospora fimiseda TaxID=252190 RepID=A0AAN7BG16_9PEZI|nr:Chloroperoxidase [Podospora fimiseda]
MPRPLSSILGQKGSCLSQPFELVVPLLLLHCHSHTTTMSSSESLAVGVYKRDDTTVSRSPCPVVNALANHGYINRDGRKIYVRELNASMRRVGMSPLLGSVFAVPTYFEYHNPDTANKKDPVPTWQRVLSLIKNPYSYFDYFGCWNPEKMDDKGKKYVDLVDLASHGAIEHDVSMSRRDIGQKQGNNDPQPDLIEDLLKHSTDGEYLTIEEFGVFIKDRLKQQLEDNPDLVYGAHQHQLNCGNITLMMGCFGDGKKIPVKYVKAIFEDERLPIEEGWKRRFWWPMGLIEFFGSVRKVAKATAMEF